MKQLDKLMRQPPGRDRTPDDADIADRVKTAIREIRARGGYGTVIVSVKDGRPSMVSTKIDEKV